MGSLTQTPPLPWSQLCMSQLVALQSHGCMVGAAVGTVVGLRVGMCVGLLLGLAVGWAVGLSVGSAVGLSVGPTARARITVRTLE